MLEDIQLRYPFLRLLVCTCLLALAAHAQQVLGSITGTVLDSSGAVVPDATVKATNIATNLEVTGKSEGNGTYVIRDLTAGTYKLTFTKDGFHAKTNTE